MDESYALWLKRYVKEQRQKNLYAVEIPFENGITNSEKLLELGEFLLPFGSDCLRLTMRQNILLRNISGKELPAVYQKLNMLDIETQEPRILNQLVACTGADTCRLGLCLSKGASVAIKNSIVKVDSAVLDKLSGFRINLSGCPNSCGQHNLAQLGFYGKVSRTDRLYPAYYVTVGGKAGTCAQLAEKIGEINARDLPQFTAEVLDTFSRSSNFHFGFNSYLEAGGKTEISNLLKKFSEVPSFAEDKNYYFDWGADTPFSVKGKGAGECSAGMFDMIDFDKEAVLKLQEDFRKKENHELVNELLYRIVFHSARMLLVTRGIEPKSREEVFSSFIEAFIEEGYVDKKYRQIVTLALQQPSGKFSLHACAVNNLAASVIELYNSMDDSLQFKSGQKKLIQEKGLQILQPDKEKGLQVLQAHKVKDLRGVGCPMNFVKTKLELAQMKTGEFLSVLLDEGAPINNVPGSVKREGHQIIKEEKRTGYWEVLIRKQGFN